MARNRGGMDIEWSGVDDMINRLKLLEDKIIWCVHQVALRFQAIFEAYARENAPWDDQTSLARSGLYAWTEIAQDVVLLHLSHSMNYGIYLFRDKIRRALCDYLAHDSTSHARNTGNVDRDI